MRASLILVSALVWTGAALVCQEPRQALGQDGAAKFCGECGAKFDSPTARFCASCGKPRGGGSAPAPAPEPDRSAPPPPSRTSETESDLLPGYEGVAVGHTCVYAGQFDMTMTQEVIARTDDELTVRTTTKMPNVSVPPTEVKIPLRRSKSPASGPTAQVKVVGTETVRVGDASFECEILEIQTNGVVARNWTAKKYPFIIKSSLDGKPSLTLTSISSGSAPPSAPSQPTPQPASSNVEREIPELPWTNAWKDTAVGAGYELSVEVEEGDASVGTSVLKYTLVERDGDEARVKVELGQRPATVKKVQLGIGGAPPPGAAFGIKTGRQAVSVPAGKFECEVFTGVALPPPTVYVDTRMPVPVKYVVKNGNRTTTVKLVRITGGGDPASTTEPLVGTEHDVFAAYYATALAAAEERFRSAAGAYTRSSAQLGPHIQSDFDAAFFNFYATKAAATIQSDGKSYRIVAYPAGAPRGRRYMASSEGGRVYSRVGAEPTESDEKLVLVTGKIKARGDWQPLELQVKAGQAVHAIARGSWQVGVTWKACGAGGSDETSSLGDLRLFAGHLRVGCLLMRVEGMDSAVGWLKLPTGDAVHGSVLAKVAGRVQFRMNVGTGPVPSGEVAVAAITRE